MSLNYDFDILALTPASAASDSGLTSFMQRIGFASEPGSEQVALFRDPRTAEALGIAPEQIRAWFIASGFGLNTYDSGAGLGHYPASDEEARLEIIARLTSSAADYELSELDDAPPTAGSFDLDAFLVALDATRPIVLAMQSEAPPEESGLLQRIRAIMPGREDGSAAASELPATQGPILDETIPAARRKFWQGRFFRVAAVAAFAMAGVQLLGIAPLEAYAGF